MSRDIQQEERYRGYDLVEEVGGLVTIFMGSFGVGRTMSIEEAKKAIDKHLEQQEQQSQNEP